jgi:hypothetical protein
LGEQSTVVKIVDVESPQEHGKPTGRNSGAGVAGKAIANKSVTYVLSLQALGSYEIIYSFGGSHLTPWTSLALAVCIERLSNATPGNRKASVPRLAFEFVADGLIAAQPPLIHPRQHWDLVVNVIVYADYLLPIVDAV